MAFLKAEYKILSVFVLFTAVLLAFKGINEGSSWLVALSFIVGALCSGLAGYIGMKVATKANVRTTNAAQDIIRESSRNCFFWGICYGNGCCRFRGSWLRRSFHSI